MTLRDRFYSPGPKRILSLDGGGIKGALTLGFLQKIEDILRKQHGNDPAFRLCDYFDLIGGTSTGAIIASACAIGMSVEEIKEKYFELGAIIFGKKYKWWNPLELDEFLKAGFDEKPLQDVLEAAFGDTTIGSEKIRTGLCIVTKRADTNSLWPIINHPDGKYFDSMEGNNKDIPLWKAVRASTAAPTYFIPQVIDVGGGLPDAVFIDGAISTANNPSIVLLMVATLKGYPFKWNLGADNILLVSVGTGMHDNSRAANKIVRTNLLGWSMKIPDMFLRDSNLQNQLILQWLSKPATRINVEGEIGDMKEDLLSVDPNSKGLLTYLRYNLKMSRDNLKELMNKNYTEDEVDDLTDMSNGASRFELYEIGKRAADVLVEADHFPGKFIRSSAPLEVIKPPESIPNIEEISERVHNSWWQEKQSQGFHAPMDCPSKEHLDYLNLTSVERERIYGGSSEEKYFKWCEFCHTSMYPYRELSEEQKEMDRATVRTVMNAINESKD